MAEVLSFTVSQRGSPAGTHVIRTEPRGSIVHLEARMQLAGPLGRGLITQTSRSHVRYHHSLSFREDQQKRGDNRSYDVRFDRSTGLVRAVRSGSDVAEIPLSRPFRDPLGMLHEIRSSGVDTDDWIIPMIGKDVHVSLVSETEVHTPLGTLPARVFRLFPGGALVWVGLEEPHPILRMAQPAVGGTLDVTLSGLGSEAARQQQAAAGGRAGGPKREQRRRQRPRRGRRRRRRDE